MNKVTQTRYVAMCRKWDLTCILRLRMIPESSMARDRVHTCRRGLVAPVVSRWRSENKRRSRVVFSEPTRLSLDATLRLQHRLIMKNSSDPPVFTERSARCLLRHYKLLLKKKKITEISWDWKSATLVFDPQPTSIGGSWQRSPSRLLCGGNCWISAGFNGGISWGPAGRWRGNSTD